MKLIVCLDDRSGMAFGGRRQSRDAFVTRDIARELGGGCLTIMPYSEKLLADTGIVLHVTEEPFDDPAATVFLETSSPKAIYGKVDELVIYRWGKKYPADLYFDLPTEGLKLIAKMTMVGSSHDKITKEVYRR